MDLEISVCEELGKTDPKDKTTVLEVLKKDLGLSAPSWHCRAILGEIYEKNLIERASYIISEWKQKQGKCSNPMGFLVDPNLLLDKQIVLYQDPERLDLVWCFEKEAIPYMLEKQQNPYTHQQFSEEFLTYLKTIKDHPEAVTLDNMIREIFGESVEMEIPEKERKITAINRVLDKIDVYLDLDDFLRSPYKYLPHDIRDNEEKTIDYLYNNRSQIIDGIPLIFAIVKYEDNMRKIDDDETPTDEKKLAKKQNNQLLAYILRPVLGEIAISIDEASRDGDIRLLERWKNSGLDLKYSDSAMDDASQNGHVNVLEWWKNSDLDLEYSDNAMEWASQNGHVNILEWWKKSDLDLKYGPWAMDWASQNGHVNVLEWWKKSDLDLKYDPRAMDRATKNGHINVLEWWKNSDLDLKYTDTESGHKDVMEWWMHSGLDLKYIRKPPLRRSPKRKRRRRRS